MHLKAAAIALLPLGLRWAAAQDDADSIVGYAQRQAPLEKDEDIVSANYPDVDIELRSPAFLEPDNVPDGFKNGTSTPTPQLYQGKFNICCL